MVKLTKLWKTKVKDLSLFEKVIVIVTFPLLICILIGALFNDKMMEYLE